MLHSTLTREALMRMNHGRGRRRKPGRFRGENIDGGDLGLNNWLAHLCTIQVLVTLSITLEHTNQISEFIVHGLIFYFKLL